MVFEYSFISKWQTMPDAGRLRKGKACVRPEDEETEPQFPRLSLIEERLNRPLIRTLEPTQEAHACPVPVVVPSPSAKLPPVTIPPPPSKHSERERYFQHNKDNGTLAGHVRGLSLHSRNGSSSQSGSFDFSDWFLNRRISLLTFLFKVVFKIWYLKLKALWDNWSWLKVFVCSWCYCNNAFSILFLGR